MENQNKSKTNPWVVVLIFLVTAIVVFSTVFLILYLNSDFKEIKANKTDYYVNMGESVKLDLTFTNVEEGEYEITSQDATIAAYNAAEKVVEGISGGQVVIVVNSSVIKNFTPIALTVTVCEGLTQDTAIMIDSAEDLININASESMLSKYYRVVNDIDLAGVEFTPLGYVNGALYEYSAIFNGAGFTISNFKITNPYQSAGLFATIGENGIVTNLNLCNVVVEAQPETDATYLCVGTVAGINNGTVQNVYVSNTSLINTTSNNCEVYYGGITGFNTGIVTQTSFENSEIVSLGYAGGIVGANVSVSERLATVKQSGTNAEVWGALHVGGVIGIAKGSIIADCFTANTAKIYAINPTTYVGGLVGTLQFVIVNSKIVNSFMINCYSVAKLGDTGIRGALIALNYNYNTSALQFNKIYGSYFTEEDTGLANAINKTLNGEAAVNVNKLTTIDLSDVTKFVSYLSETGDNVMWDFGNIWTFDQNNYPTLVKFGMVSNFDTTTFKEEGAIYTVVDLVNIANNLSGQYVLKADLDLSVLNNWNAIGTEENPFTGSLMADSNPDSLELYKIYNLKISENADNLGLFGYAGENAKISNITIDGATISGQNMKNVSVIAAVNKGIIENCSVLNANIKLDGAQAVSGFVTAVNNGKIFNSFVDRSEISGADAGVYSIGSIAGVNNGIVDSCYTLENTKITANTGNASVIVGGLVGENGETAEVRFSFSQGIFTSYNVGGLVGVNKNNVYESYSNNTLIGKFVGGLAYNVSFGANNKFGAISNCFTTSKLQGVDANSVKSGFAYVIDYCSEGENKGKYGLIYHCFSAAEFDGIGQNYFETHSRVRTDTMFTWYGGKIDRVAGFVIDSIYDKQGRNAEEITNGIFNSFFDPLTHEPAIGLETSQCFDVNNFLAQNFSENIWKFSDSYYPELINVVSPNVVATK